MDITVVIDSNLETLDRIGNKLQDTSGLLENIGAYMVASIVANFEEQGRPNTWADLKPATWERKKGDMILHESGLLRAGIMYWVEGGTVFIGPSGPASLYAATHQFGRDAIKARPYLVFQDEDVAVIRSMVYQEITQ